MYKDSHLNILDCHAIREDLWTDGDHSHARMTKEGNRRREDRNMDDGMEESPLNEIVLGYLSPNRETRNKLN